MTDSRVVYAVAIIIAFFVGGFYYYSGKSRNLDNHNNAHLSSSAEKLQLLQTDAHGQLAIQAQVGSIEQWAAQNTVIAKQIDGNSYQNGQPDFHFNAQNAYSNDNFRHVILSHGVQIERHSTTNPVSFSTAALTADTQTKQISTDQQVLLHSPQAQFQSQGLRADLVQGDYQFFKIRGLYAPVQP